MRTDSGFIQRDVTFLSDLPLSLVGLTACRPAVLATRRRHAPIPMWSRLFDGVVAPLVRAHFYATETGVHKNRIFYFRKPLWQKMQSVAMAELTTTMYTPLDTAAAAAALKDSKLGFSYLRMVPKATGMRAIVNMSRRQASNERSAPKLSINQKLANLFHVLRFEKDREPEQLGASVFGLDDVYAKLKVRRLALHSNP